MAKCDQGYPCTVCGKYVDAIKDSGLYLRYIIGDVDAGQLLNAPEHHLLCDPSLTQYIIDEEFPPVIDDGPFDKRLLGANEVREREDLVTRGWKRLLQVRKLGIPLTEYPLDEVRKANS